ncbi:MAG TPA: ABC transporter substrate-binding protein [Burkholderiales bacterium]|jgi:branched-chain amino acid transport system substrate-binding protein|nr:ABC transporter substrate-binding protein [Burkholderiales bacterium]
MPSMTSWITSLLALLFCAGAAWAQPGPIVVGATVAQSGMLADRASDYRKGLLLWEEQVNAGGGISGRPVKLALLDDASEAIAVGKLYARLVGEMHADALIGPYGTAATLMAAAQAEAARRVMVDGAAASRSVHKRSPRYVFQAGIPYSAYGTGALEIAKAAGYRKLYIVTRDDLASREMAEAARATALEMKLEPSDVDIHAVGASDFTVPITKARAAGAEAWIAFGEARDAAEMVKSFRRFNYAPRLFFARGAADPLFVSLVGQDAEATLAAVEYSPRFGTPGNAEFVKTFSAKWSGAPTVPAAEAYAAATVLAEGLRRAGTDAAKLREALATSEIPTVLGPYKVDPKTGEQVAARPMVVQITRGRPEVVWPSAGATRHAVPYPQWSERRPMKDERR